MSKADPTNHLNYINQRQVAMQRREEDGRGRGEPDHPGLLIHGRGFQTPVKMGAEKR